MVKPTSMSVVGDFPILTGLWVLVIAQSPILYVILMPPNTPASRILVEHYWSPHHEELRGWYLRYAPRVCC
jgi:hypothetical protein